jgi:ethanolamine utilization protein EutA
LSKELRSLRSVGIDIGSTTSHLVFSRLVLELDEEKHKFEIAGRNVTYLSKVILTPYKESNSIDIDALSSFLLSEYKAAGHSPEEIDTGAIIITGEAAKKHNAERIVRLFSNQLGKFVCATAGPHYEAVLAAHGSGAVDQSGRENNVIMNVDIGGGTSKIAIVDRGEVVDTSCVSVGARLIAIDNVGQVIRIEDMGRFVAKVNDIDLALGQTLSQTDQHRISATLVNSLYEVIRRKDLSTTTKQLMVTTPLTHNGRIDKIAFSGGVAEYIYGCTDQDFGDLGRILGEMIRKSKNLGIPICMPVERIRATVIGVSQYTVQISGNTTFVSNPKLLPLRNLPVVSLEFNAATLTERGMKEAIIKALEMHDVTQGEADFAVAFHRSTVSHPTYDLMKTLGKALLSALSSMIEKKTLVLVFEADIGKGMGRLIQEELNARCNLVSIDEIKLRDFNFIDIGEPTSKEGLIPVVVKSFVFQQKTNPATETYKQTQS